jgi:hypothetical protein
MLGNATIKLLSIDFRRFVCLSLFLSQKYLQVARTTLSMSNSIITPFRHEPQKTATKSS